MDDDTSFDTENEENLNIDFDVSTESEAMEVVGLTIDRFLDTASVEKAFGEPIQAGETLIIPCAEVMTGLGFGVGVGYGNDTSKDGSPEAGGGGGGGGGGRTFSRPVAVIIASPEGVRVEPVVDVTKIALAMFTAVGFMGAMAMRIMRRTQGF